MARRGKRGAPAAVTLLAGVVAVAAAFIIGQSSDSFGLAVSSGFGRQALVASAVSEAARETGSAQNGGSSPRGDDAFVEVSGQLQRPTSPSVSPSPQANAAAIERAATPITTSPLIDRPVVSIGTPPRLPPPPRFNRRRPFLRFRSIRTMVQTKTLRPLAVSAPQRVRSPSWVSTSLDNCLDGPFPLSRPDRA